MRPLRILLVDDHADSLSLTNRLLAKSGHAVLCADGFASALRMAQHAQFDVLVTDIALGDGDGWTLYRRLREMRPRLPAIAVSGHALKTDHLHSDSEGMFAHVTKPFDLAHLLRTIDECAARALGEQQAS